MKKSLLLLFLAGLAIPAMAQQYNVQVGYVFPAGVQQGTTTRIMVAGQYLKGAKEVYISGKGAKATIIRNAKGKRDLNNKELRYMFARDLLSAYEARLREKGVEETKLEKQRAKLLKKWPWSILKRKDIDLEGEKPLDHPLMEGLKDKSLEELLHVQDHFMFPKKMLQPNRQLEEMVVVDITVDKNAPVGNRELRLRTSRGLTKAVVFQIGQLREVRELEPNNIQAFHVPDSVSLMKEHIQKKPLNLPILINGQIMPGDVDRFRFIAKKGQKLTFDVDARRLIPFLADAVPGWFQAVITLYDANGKEVAYADENRFKPDPVMRFEVPEDGEYELAIRDSIYRGREDFVYRISINDKQAKEETFPTSDIPADVFPSHVAALPRCSEKEGNNNRDKALGLKLPVVVEGRIGRAGDVDMFRFAGKKGESIVAEAYARRLGSSLDSLLRLMDDAGKVIAWNDDYIVKDKHLHIDRLGLNTHHADSYLITELPKDGVYYIQVSDVQRHGGKQYQYRLRVGQASPDFSLRYTPSGIFARPGEIVPVTVYAMRKDGFTGAIEVHTAEDEDAFGIKGGRIIPPGQNSVRFTVTAPVVKKGGLYELKLNGIANVDGKTITRKAVPADNVMQAFLYRHLVPVECSMFAVKKQKWPVPQMDYVGDKPVALIRGKETVVRIKMRKRKDLDQFRLTLNNPPEGVSIEEKVLAVDEGIELRLKLSKDIKTEDMAGNLIIQVLKENTRPAKDGKPAKTSRWPMGYLPAIPFRIAGK